MEDAPSEPGVRAARRRVSAGVSARARRRRRRAVGTLLFVLIAVAVIAAAVLTFTGSSDAPSSTASTRSLSSTTTTAALPPAGPFALTDGVNVRAGPAATYPSLGTLPTGTKVMVQCVITGATVNGPKGPTNLWVRITGTTPVGYVTNEYVDTGAAVDDRSKIPLCPGT